MTANTKKIPLTITAAYELALKRYNEGNLNQTEELCGEITKIAPGHSEATHLLALVALQNGQNEKAMELAGKAASRQPKMPGYWNTFGLACFRSGKIAEASKHLRKALTLHPDFPEALVNLATVQLSQGKWEAGAESCEKAISLKPDFVLAHYHLARSLEFGGKISEAIQQYRRVIELQPNFAEAHLALAVMLYHSGALEDAISHCRQALSCQYNLPEAHNSLGCMLQAKGLITEAVSSFRSALQLRPDFPEAHFNLANILYAQSQLDEAINHCRQATAAKDEDHAAHNTLGCMLLDVGNYQEAATHFQKAALFNKKFALAKNNLGNALKLLGDSTGAIQAYREALEIQPDLPQVFSNLGMTLQDQGHIAEAMHSYREALRLRPDYLEAQSNLLLALHYDGDIDPADIEKAHQDWGNTVAAAIKPMKTTVDNGGNADRPLRLGFVSGDFYQHVVSFLLANVFDAIDVNQIQIFCYANNARSDSLTERLKKSAFCWRSIAGINDADAAALISQDKIDILVDLSGHTSKHRLLIFAHKPAPIQITWLGYPDTTGLQTMDYRITDAIADPIGEEGWHSEKLLRLPEGFLCFGDPHFADLPAAPPCEKDGRVTFGCFNNNAKITPQAIELWAEILRQAPGSRLLLKNDAFLSPEVISFRQEQFARNGIGAERVEFVSRVETYTDHLGYYGKIDIALDVFPYNGTTTTCDAIWMGVPVIALRGNRHVSRVGASILTRVGLEDLIAETGSDYVAKAVTLAADTERLIKLRQELRGRLQNSTLGDAPRFTATLTKALKDIWRERQPVENTAKTKTRKGK